jgi:hypothetical protein
MEGVRLVPNAPYPLLLLLKRYKVCMEKKYHVYTCGIINMYLMKY